MRKNTNSLSAEPVRPNVLERSIKGAVVLCVLACFVFVGSGLMSRVVQRGDFPSFYQGGVFPPGVLAGHDFWVTYTYAGVLLEGGNIKKLPESIPETMRGYFSGPRNVSNYPPFIFMLYAPYHLLSYADAYVVQMILLTASNLFVIGMAVWLLMWATREKGAVDPYSRAVMAVSVFTSMSFLAISGYGFAFSIERGNCDIFSMVFAWAFLCVLMRFPKRIWLQTILLSCAIHIKITPALLVALLIWRHRWRCIIPLLVINLALLLCWGVGNARIFIESLMQFSVTPDGWWGDHSAYSFAFTVLKPMGYPVALCEKALIALTLTLWGITWVVLGRRGNTPVNQLLLFVASFPVMHIVPNCSNDYKLVIIYAPLAVLALAWFHGYVYQKQKGILVLVLFVVLYFISKSGGLFEARVFANKFPMLFITQCLTLVAILRPVDLLKNKALE